MKVGLDPVGSGGLVKGDRLQAIAALEYVLRNALADLLDQGAHRSIILCNQELHDEPSGNCITQS